jgi:hypothetical protein
MPTLHKLFHADIHIKLILIYKAKYIGNKIINTD